MSKTKIILFTMLTIGSVLVISIFATYYTGEKIVTYKCSPEFWQNNLDLWKTVGVDFNDDFDETFGKDYFEPDITLAQAITKEGLGIEHLARSGTTAYLNAKIDPKIDEEIVHKAVHFGYIHQIDNYLENCNEIKKEIPNIPFN